MNRGDLQELSELRLKDAEVLLEAQRWQAAYYLLGYSVECALKACVSKQFLPFEVPDKSFVNRFYTHSLDQLLDISGVKSEMVKSFQADPNFSINWNTVKDWTEQMRYELGINEGLARGLHQAITDAKSGVLPWLRTQW